MSRRTYGYGTSFAELLEEQLHSRVFCRGDCKRHPDVTHSIADQLRAELDSAPEPSRAILERAELLARELPVLGLGESIRRDPPPTPGGWLRGYMALLPDRAPWNDVGAPGSLVYGPWPDPPGAIPWASLGEVPDAPTGGLNDVLAANWRESNSGPGWLPTLPGTQLEFSGPPRRARPCWSCRWGPRRWRRRRHWTCLHTVAPDVLEPSAVLPNSVDPWGHPWCLCEAEGRRHAHMPSGAIVIYQAEP